MDTITLFEKMAGLNDMSLGSIIAEDILSAVNTKIASLEKESAVRTPVLSNIMNIAKGATPEQMKVFSQRLRAVGMEDKLKKMTSSTNTLGRPTSVSAPAPAPAPKAVVPSTRTTGGFGATGGYSSAGFDPTGGFTNRSKNLMDYLAKR